MTPFILISTAVALQQSLYTQVCSVCPLSVRLYAPRRLAAKTVNFLHNMFLWVQLCSLPAFIDNLFLIYCHQSNAILYTHIHTHTNIHVARKTIYIFSDCNWNWFCCNCYLLRHTYLLLLQLLWATVAVYKLNLQLYICIVVCVSSS